LINLWSCFFLFNLKSSLLLANYCNFCLFWSFLVLHFILSNWSIFFVVVGNFALWLIFFWYRSSIWFYPYVGPNANQFFVPSSVIRGL
jgi:hypothetical protein